MTISLKNILVIRTDRMGDVILTTPIFKALRVNFPSARISVLVQPALVDLVEGNPFVNDILVDDRRGKNRGLFGFFRLVSDIRFHNFDAVFVFHTKRRTNLLAFLAGIPLRIGYRDRNWGGLLNRPIRDERALGMKHEAEFCMDQLEVIGLETVDLEPCVPVNDIWADWADRFFKENNLTSTVKKNIAVHLGASDPSKCWPVNSYATLMESLHVRSEEYEFILVGTAEVCSDAGILKSKLNFPVIDLTGQTTVAQLASVLSRCDALISNDSGPVHMADALGTPVISIFTRNQPGINPERWRPLSSNSCFLAPKPNLVPVYSKAGAVSADSVEMVDIQQVLDAVDVIFKVC